MSQITNYLESLLEKYRNNKLYRTVYKNTKIAPGGSVWISEFSKDTEECYIPKSANLLNTEYTDIWKQLVDEHSTGNDCDELKHNPTSTFIYFLQSKEYDGFQIGDDILIFDKNILKSE